MVYIIREKDSEYVKIGYTGNSIVNRFGKLQTDNPRELVILKTYEGDKNTEFAIQVKFIDLHVRGDWFIFTEEMLNVNLEELEYKNFNGIKNCAILKRVKDYFKYHIDNELFINSDTFPSTGYKASYINIIRDHNKRNFGTVSYKMFLKLEELADYYLENRHIKWIKNKYIEDALCIEVSNIVLQKKVLRSIPYFQKKLKGIKI